MNDPMKAETKSVCGAMNRQGKPCQKPPLKGKSRCMLHGGKTPKGRNSGALNENHRHGLYANSLSEAERAAWDNIPVGDVDTEIKMLKIKLARAFALEAEINENPNSAKHMGGFVLSEIRRSSGENGGSTDAISRRPDVSAIMNWAYGRLAQLERTRIDLLTASRESSDGIGDTARDLIEAMRQMASVETDK